MPHGRYLKISFALNKYELMLLEPKTNKNKSINELTPGRNVGDQEHGYSGRGGKYVTPGQDLGVDGGSCMHAKSWLYLLKLNCPVRRMRGTVEGRRVRPSWVCYY